MTSEVAGVKAMRLLIVDDNKDFCATTAMILTRLIPNCTVDAAHTARGGLAMMQTNRYDCVLLDLVLPCLQGEELLEKILTCDPETPVIVISGKIGDRPELDKDLISLGAQDVVNKVRADPKALATAVLHAIARHKHRAMALRHIDSAADTAAQLKQSIATQAAVIDETKSPPS